MILNFSEIAFAECFHTTLDQIRNYSNHFQSLPFQSLPVFVRVGVCCVARCLRQFSRERVLQVALVVETMGTQVVSRTATGSCQVVFIQHVAFGIGCHHGGIHGVDLFLATKLRLKFTPRGPGLIRNPT